MTLEMRGICKSFGSNDVLKHVDFSIQGGEICALLGENGAGKSTLMNILGGVLPADRGEIVIDGTPVHFRTPSDSLSAGVAFIHQELSLINDLAIYENMFIGRELKTKYGLLDAKTMIQKTQEVFDRLELHLDPRTMVRELDASYKQIVEISRAMMMEASLIIMDEPTTSLTDPEIERVFDMMRMLQKQNVAIVFISHKLKEVMEVCNRYTVLRDGNMVAAGPVAEVTTADLARFMVGHDVRTENLHQDKELGGEILRGEGLGDGAHFRDISFTVHAGEVLGVTGLLGDGRSELFQAVFGDLPYTGQLFMEGQPVKVTSTPQAIRLGIGYVPRNRKENGIIKDMDIVENGSMVTLPRLARRGLIDQRRRDAEFDRQVGELHIKMGKKTDLITSLSGGNQQKVVLAKWLSAHPKVLILDNPTQGVDVGAKEEIYDIILRLAREGVAVVVLSSEAQEIIRVCDRALVLYHGALQGEHERADHHAPGHRRRGAFRTGNSYRGVTAMGTKELEKKSSGGGLVAAWKQNPLVSTGLVLILMIVVQTAIMIYNFGEGSVGELLLSLLTNWLNILRNNAPVGIIALGMTFVIISGGIDLSVGSTLVAVGAMVMMVVDGSATGLLAGMGITGVPAYIIAIAVGLVFGALLGWLNGVLIAHGKLPPFIATLGTMQIFRSVTQHLTQHANPSVPKGFLQIANLKIGSFYIMPILYWLAIAAVLYVVSKRTTFGRHVFAVGSNIRTARLSGINVNKVKRRIYMLTGMLVAIAAIIQVSRIGSMDYASAGSGYEMDAIAAVIVGGTSMSGGKGSIVGTVLGMLIIGVMNNLLTLFGVPPFLREACKGVIVIVAVLLQKKEADA